MDSTVSGIADLDSHARLRERPAIDLLATIGKEIGGKRRVEGVCKKNKLELNLKYITQTITHLRLNMNA